GRLSQYDRHHDLERGLRVHLPRRRRRARARAGRRGAARHVPAGVPQPRRRGGHLPAPLARAADRDRRAPGRRPARPAGEPPDRARADRRGQARPGRPRLRPRLRRPAPEAHRPARAREPARDDGAPGRGRRGRHRRRRRRRRPARDRRAALRGRCGVSEARPQRTPMSDLFASAVHRFGSVWADLMVGALAALGGATVPVALVQLTGGSLAETIVIAFFCLLGWVMLRGLPEPAPRRRVLWTYMTGGLVGILSGAIVLILSTYAVVVLPIFLFAVPAIAAGDVGPAGAITHSVALAVRNFSRTWLVWLIMVLFSAPVVLAMLLIVSAFADNTTSTVIGLALAAPIVWPFSALFLRALYGDLTGRAVVAPQDRTA